MLLAGVIRAVAVALALGAAMSALAASPARGAGPKVPFVLRDQCPGECCGFGQWIARSALVAYRHEGSRSDVAFRVHPGDTLRAIRGNVHVERAGMVLVTEAGDGFQRGDTVFVMSYGGEGAYTVWYRNQLRVCGDFWLEPDAGEPGPRGELRREARMVWWVYVEDQRGRGGWLRLLNRTSNGFWLEEQIEGMDACA